MPNLTLEKRRSFEAVSRRTKSSEVLMKNSKKSITDLFFKGMEDDDLIKGNKEENNGPPAADIDDDNPFK